MSEKTQEGRALLADATPGPWVSKEEYVDVAGTMAIVAKCHRSFEDAALIAYAVNHLEALLCSAEECERLRKGRDYVKDLFGRACVEAERLKAERNELRAEVKRLKELCAELVGEEAMSHDI